MASKLFLVLVLLTTRFGVECNGEIIIKTYKEKDSESAKTLYENAEVSITFGKEGIKSEQKIHEDRMSGFICREKNTSFIIRFKVSIGLGYTPSLKVFDNSKALKNKESNEVILKWGELKKQYCLLYGTWWPSKGYSVEFYLNFLNVEPEIREEDVISYSGMIADKQISSMLMIERQKYLPGTPQSVDIKSLSSEDLLKLVPIDHEIKGKDKVIQTFMSQCNSMGKVCIGYQQCKFNKNPKALFMLGKEEITLGKAGRFNMAFHTKKIEVNKAMKVAATFAKSDVTEKTIDTVFANIECLENEIKFIPIGPLRNLRLLSDSKILI